MSKVALSPILILVLACLGVCLVACGTAGHEVTATSPPVETPEIDLTTPAAVETPEETEVTSEETSEVGAETSPTPAASGLTAVINSGESAAAGKPFTFDATQSKPGETDIVDYVWTLGDGTTMFGISVQHAYSEPGFYTVTLIVTDADGQTDTAAKVVEIVELEQLETPAAEDESTLVGTFWELSNAMRGTTITLAFDEATVAGAAGCNDYEAAYSITEGAEGEIAIMRISTTSFSCTPEIMAQESGYLGSLASARTFIFEGNALAIETGQGTLSFVRPSE